MAADYTHGPDKVRHYTRIPNRIRFGLNTTDDRPLAIRALVERYGQPCAPYLCRAGLCLRFGKPHSTELEVKYFAWRQRVASIRRPDGICIHRCRSGSGRTPYERDEPPSPATHLDLRQLKGRGSDPVIPFCAVHSRWRHAAQGFLRSLFVVFPSPKSRSRLGRAAGVKNGGPKTGVRVDFSEREPQVKCTLTTLPPFLR